MATSANPAGSVDRATVPAEEVQWVRERAGRSPLLLAAWGLPALFVVALLPRLWAFIDLGLTRISWPWLLDYTEGLNLYITHELAHGVNIYRQNGPDSFMSTPYPPVFHLVTAPLDLIFGANFEPGRIVSFICTLAIGLLIAYVVRRLGGLWQAGVAAGLLWLTLSSVIAWAPFYKQDMLAYALDLGGLAWALRFWPGVAGVSRWAGLKSVPPRGLYLSAMLFTLAFYTKQSALSGAAATTGWLFICSLGLGLRFVFAFAAMVLVPFAVGNLILNGGLWNHLIVYAGSLPFSERRSRRLLTRMVTENWPMLAIASSVLVGLLVTLARNVGLRGSPVELFKTAWSRLSSPWTAVALYSLLGLVSTVSKVGIDGANYNHLIDALLPVCILVGLALAHVWRLLSGRQAQARIAGAVGLLVAVALVIVQGRIFVDPAFDIYRWSPVGAIGAAHDADMRGFSNLVASTPGDIYSEDLYLLMKNGKRVLYDDPTTFTHMADVGVWDESVFVQSIRDRRFSLIIRFHDNVWWTTAGLQALIDNYQMKFESGMDAFEPKIYPDSPEYTKGCTLSAGGDSIKLAGYSLAPGVAWDGIKPGEVLRAGLYWQAQGEVQQSYASYIHMVSDKGELVAGQDNPATGAAQPTTAWQPNSGVLDKVSLPLPANLQPGRYLLVAGMYHVDGGSIKALPASCPQGDNYGEAVNLGWVQVR